ncbi:complement decay-accelerating factor, GPI-anchored isoform X2 [Mugil cephalus]|uniref:complement decay-accelerating factor, GPI-anchored isoform X2 n=1 Tax=Mugil cephalus TaxID=48193 RepID=UPI001FB7683A|nr:complement decay-accelerating factor, GPI-anchored isoform X2 [Mugil cephalus]
MCCLLLQFGMGLLVNTRGQRSLGSLLLVYLFVAKAAADCLKPDGSDQTVLSDEALLLNDFPEGTIVTIECANGYVVDSGNGAMTCTNDEWTKPDLVCRRMDCGVPPPQPHMSFDTTGGTLFGDTIEVLCDIGYEISGSSYKQCYATGWSGRSYCEIILCETPAPVANGKILRNTQEHVTYGEIIQYTCDDGFTLVGNANITCTENWEYSSQPPECREVTTTHGVATTKMVSTPMTPMSLSKGSSTPPDSSATSTPLMIRSITSRATATSFVQGGKGVMATKDKATTASVTSTTTPSWQDNIEVSDNRIGGHTLVIISVMSVVVVSCIFVMLLHRFLLKRKGSYDTREDLKLPGVITVPKYLNPTSDSALLMEQRLSFKEHL